MSRTKHFRAYAYPKPQAEVISDCGLIHVSWIDSTRDPEVVTCGSCKRVRSRKPLASNKRPYGGTGRGVRP